MIIFKIMSIHKAFWEGTISHALDEQSYKKTIEHKTVVFLGHMNDNSNFTFPITLT